LDKSLTCNCLMTRCAALWLPCG